MAKHPPFEPDPVIEAYKKDVDRTLIRENLKRTPEDRVRAMMRVQQLSEELRRAMQEARRQQRLSCLEDAA